MPSAPFKPDSLVIYKQKPARILKRVGKKLAISTIDGGVINVRPKDILFLHPGPVNNLSNLSTPAGEIEIAWELLSGETTSLKDLAELAFDTFTPSTALATWQLIEDGLYFSGTPSEVTVRTAQEVEEEKRARELKAAEQLAWESFLKRAGERQFTSEDQDYLQDIIDLAEGRRDKSRVLQSLGQAQTSENAHAFLLKTGVWTAAINPYPRRAGLPLTSSNAPLGRLEQERRRDLTHLSAFAIDDADSQDPDDALSWEDGRLWVHIADAGALVAPESPADIEARARGANLYLPEGPVFMLPPQATQTLALGLKDTSPALSFGFYIDKGGQISDLEIVSSWVRVTRLSYQETEKYIADHPFSHLQKAANIYQERRREDGAIAIDLPEVKVRLNNHAVEITPLPNIRSRDLVRDAMLMTGEAVAKFCQENDIPIPYTTQDAPSDKLPEGNKPSDMFATRKLLKPSQKSLSPDKHHGLGMDKYVQATSPLRRYLDLVVHQQLRAYIKGRQLMSEQDVTNLIGSSYSAIRDIRFVERRSNQHWTCVYLLNHPDWNGEGIIVEKRGKRMIVLLPQLGLETSLYSSKDSPLDSTIHLAVTGVDLVNLKPSFQIIKSKV